MTAAGSSNLSDTWPQEYAGLLSTFAQRPAEDTLATVEHLGRALADAAISMERIATVHMTALAELVSDSQRPAAECIDAATTVFGRLMGAFEVAWGGKLPAVVSDESEGWYRGLMQAAADAIVVSDSETGIILDVNERVEGLVGRPRDELVGQSQTILHPPEEAEYYVWRFREHVRHGGWPVEALEVRHSDGRRIPVELSSSVVELDGRLVIQGILRDVSGRRRFEAKLRESEERYRTLVENIDSGIALISKDYRILMTNSRLGELFGQPAGEMVSRRCFSELEKRDEICAHCPGTRAMASGRPAEATSEGVRDDGVRFWIRTRAIPLRDSRGGISGFIAVIEDTTERSKTDEMLHLTQFSIDSAADSLFWIGSDARVLYVNEAGCRALGYSREELLGMRVPDFDMRITMAGWAEHWAEVKQHRTFALETILRTREGRTRPYEVTVNYIEYGGKEYNCVFARDISERKRVERELRKYRDHLEDLVDRRTAELEELNQRLQAELTVREQTERALRESEERFRQVAENINECFWLTEPDTGRALYLSPAFERIWGRPVSVGYARPLAWLDFLHADDRPAVLDAMERRKQGEATLLDYRVVRPDGTVRWLRGRAFPVRDAEGRVYRVAGISEDITERKQAEEAARQHQEQLAHVARVSMMGEVSSGLAHELAQPLSAILYFAKGCSAQLRRDDWGRSEIAGTMDKIAAQAERAGEFIRRLKAFVRKAQPQRVPEEVNPIVREALAFAEPVIRAHHVTVDFEPAEVLPTVVVDKIQIEQVILNLVQNAIEALRELPEHDRRLQVRTYDDGDDRVCVSVHDSGPGIGDDIVASVFDPFFTTKAAGTGLGLSISRSIMEAHEGNLWVEGSAESGATFGLTLRAAGGDDQDVG